MLMIPFIISDSILHLPVTETVIVIKLRIVLFVMSPRDERSSPPVMLAANHGTKRRMYEYFSYHIQQNLGSFPCIFPDLFGLHLCPP